jgi:hypothetical protein
MVPKSRSKYTNGDKKLLFMDAEYCQFNKITSCKNTRDI